VESTPRIHDEDERRNALFLVEQLQREGEREAVIARRVRELLGEDEPRAASSRPRRLADWLRRAA
jgi:hypothetical protein